MMIKLSSAPCWDFLLLLTPLCKLLSIGSGSVDVFCQLGVLREDGQEKGSFLKQKKNIKDWQKEKLMESVGMTSVKSGSLEPEWDEEIHL